MLDDPTSGVDPGAREKIFDRLRDAAAEGVGVLVFSTEPEQLANYCSRVLVLREGRIVRELDRRRPWTTRRSANGATHEPARDAHRGVRSAQRGASRARSHRAS